MGVVISLRQGQLLLAPQLGAVVEGGGCWVFSYGLYDLAGGVWEYTNGNYVTGSGATAAVYTPTNASANYANLVDMFQTDANVYIPYFDAYPNPPLTSSVNDITNGKYGLGASAIPTNTYWGIYAGKLGLGHGIFEASSWVGDHTQSISPTYVWQTRGGYADHTTNAGVESMSSDRGHAYTYGGARSIVRSLNPASSEAK